MLIILDKYEKPPMGLIAKFIIDLDLNNKKLNEKDIEKIRLDRIFEISNVINRYITHSKEINLEWIKELNEHLVFFNDKYSK